MRQINYTHSRIALCLLLAACGFTPPAAPDGGIDAAPVLPTVDFEVRNSGADEMTNSVMISVVLSSPAETAVSVTYAVAGGTATPGTDFTVAGDMLEFAVGETRKEIVLAIVPDLDEAEPSETIDLVLSAASGATLGDVNHTVTISNLILPRVQFLAVTTTTAEGTQTMVAVTLDKAAAGPSSVVLGIAGGSATPTDDFAIADGTTIDIPANATTAMVDIGEVNDALDEDDETVLFALRSPSANLVIGNLQNSTHNITDNDDPPSIQFGQATSQAMENSGTATVEVTLSAPSGKQVTVNYVRNGGNAVAGDATVVGTSLTFAPGDTSESISVTLVADGTDENDETVGIDLSANPGNATLATPSSHTLTILDTDPAPTVEFTEASTAQNEGNLSVVLTVQLSAASARNITVPFSVAGTANDPLDYSITAGSLTFNAGTTSRSITIDTVEDVLDEDNETIVVTLGTPTNATLAATSEHTNTINDDDNLPTVRFDPAEADRQIAEGDPPPDGPNFVAFSYNVVLSVPSGRTVTVPVNLSGTASNGSDFTIQTPLPLVFAPGEVSKTIDYRILNDTVNESDETLIFTLGSNPTNANDVNPTVRTHRIVDDAGG